jgi:CheY-like chemotaxis protein
MELDPLKVLAVEDDPIAGDLLRIVLEFKGHEVKVFPDPELALKQKLSGYDVVVTDYHLPKMSGLKMAERIRKGSEIPIILLTSNIIAGDFRHIPDEIQEALDKGLINGAFPKPIGSECIAAIERWGAKPSQDNYSCRLIATILTLR